MAEERSRSVLGDITNKIRKRGVSEAVKTGGKSLYFDENSVGVMGKRSCVSPHFCTDVNSLKGNENKESDVLDHSSVFEASKEVYGDFKDGRCLGESKPCDVNQKCEGCVGFQKERGAKSIPIRDDTSKDTVFVENKSHYINLAIGENIVNLEIHDGDNVLGSSRMSNEEKKSNSYNVDLDDLRTVSEKDDDCILLGENLSPGDKLCGIKASQKDCNDVDKFVLSQSASIDCTMLPESQESKIVELETQTGNDCPGGTDSMKDCCCSFCTKAGYILLDLNYQDIKGRVTAIRKSQKEANILAERSCRGKAAEKHSIVGNSNRASQLEPKLMYQWRSLFQQMSSLYEQESNQLEASLLLLSDLKGRCKTEMVPDNDV